MCSIDENNIGKRKNIMDRKFKIKCYTFEDFDFIINDLWANKIEKVEFIESVMKKYKFGEDEIKKVIDNFGNLKKDVLEDINLFWKDVFKKEEVLSKDKRDIRVFGSRCYNGEKSDLVKSCFQKYVRRNMFDKGIYFLIEMDLFKKF